MKTFKIENMNTREKIHIKADYFKVTQGCIILINEFCEDGVHHCTTVASFPCDTHSVETLLEETHD